MRLSRLKRAVFVLVALWAITAVAAGWYLWCDWVPDSVIRGLPGATRAEVREQLGEPTDVSSGTDYERWYYRRPWRWAEFRVDFDLAGRVESWSYDR